MSHDNVGSVTATFSTTNYLPPSHHSTLSSHTPPLSIYPAVAMDATVELSSRYHTLSSSPDSPPHRRLLSYIRTQPLDCLHSFLSFHHYVVVSYSLILTHFFLLHLTSFFLLFDHMFGTALPARPYLILLSFLAARSILLLVLFTLRLRFPTLWYPSPTCPHARRFHLLLIVSRLLSVAFLVFGALHWLILTPPAAHSDHSGSFVGWSAAVPCLLLRECVSLLVPIVALAYLGVKGRRRAQVSAFIPYLLTTSSPSELTGTTAGDERVNKRRGLTAAEIAQLGEERYASGTGAEDEEADVCAICLNGYTGGMRVRRLRCSHSFHVGCVDVWLQQRSTCPLCVQHCAPLVSSSSVTIAPLVVDGSSEAAADVELHALER